MAGPRPQTTMSWFTRSAGPGILRAMALGQVEISHATFAAIPTNKTNNYLRDFLAAVGVLPPYDAELERVIGRSADGIDPPDVTASLGCAVYLPQDWLCRCCASDRARPRQTRCHPALARGPGAVNLEDVPGLASERIADGCESCEPDGSCAVVLQH